jgi:hypothetical protein
VRVKPRGSQCCAASWGDEKTQSSATGG